MKEVFNELAPSELRAVVQDVRDAVKSVTDTAKEAKNQLEGEFELEIEIAEEVHKVALKAVEINGAVSPDATSDEKTVLFKPQNIDFTYEGNTITAVAEDSQAEEEGVEVGWVIKSVDQTAVPNKTTDTTEHAKLSRQQALITRLCAEAAAKNTDIEVVFAVPVPIFVLDVCNLLLS